MTCSFTSAESLADAVLATVGKRVVLGLSVGIGKATAIADALFARAAQDSTISLTIFTGLTLETPRASSDLERRFLEPFVARHYADWPTPRYAQALRDRALPDNVEVHEFYLRPGGWLGNAEVQQSYISVNYSQVAGTLIELGVNVIAQLVSARPLSPDRYSLSSNPEVTLDLLDNFRERKGRGENVVLAGQINTSLPWMGGAAELAAEEFDLLLEDAPSYAPFGLPSRAVTPADYATGMHAASLIADGGTLQVGIGSLSDAVAHCLILRQREPEVFSDVLARLPGGSKCSRRAALPVCAAPFKQGLFASTELMSDALLALFAADIVRRPADEDDDALIHAGFFVGTARLYERLRALPEARRRQIRMQAISSVNTLYGDELRKRRQRRNARFINETMMVTLLGAAVSDGLEDGRVVSGVGGQFDFIRMAHALDDAHSILVCRARRVANGRPESNVRWSYGHVTVPRHYRDIVVTEYGVASLKGRSDEKVIDAMLGVTDHAFAGTLAEAARKARKLPTGYRPPADLTRNTPAAIDKIFADETICPHFPEYPLGSDFTPVEQHLVRALGWLKNQPETPLARAQLVVRALLDRPATKHEAALTRLSLDSPDGLRERLTARLIDYALSRTRT